MNDQQQHTQEELQTIGKMSKEYKAAKTKAAQEEAARLTSEISRIYGLGGLFKNSTPR